ncbi:MAG: GIY-YIG nuclease family protein [Cyclobacteriaceae bacterium]|nr:GIY-YIG nuclease family protein [Cyclobacteriaceae bacterium]
MSFTVYILFSKKTQKYYTGQTQDLENRLHEHNTGETSSLKSGMPWRLVWSQECASRSEAMKLENKIKKRGAKRFLDDLSRGA